MALSEEPLRYLRKYLNVEEDLTEDIVAATANDAPAAKPPAPPRAKRTATAKPAKAGRTKPLPRSLPTDTPAFLRRPYTP